MRPSFTAAPAIAFAERERAQFYFFEQGLFFKIGADSFARFKAIQSGVRASVVGYAGVFADYLDLRQLVTLARFQIIRIVRRSDLHHASAELRIGDFIEDDRDRPIH
jgi:hypothetical protein